ncbi:MAG: hypothetical protein Q4G27_00705 [Flavobacteriaceae bacterium]|nr:hypothetical protein [Flavobacteriaceae bacterium]
MRKLMSILAVAAMMVGTAQEKAVTLTDDSAFKNFRPYDQSGLHIFEPVKDTTSTSNNLVVKLGGDFALQFQAIGHENNGQVPLYNIGNNFNLATANMDIDVRLYDGVNMHLRTYLSSRHHPEPYVKGGYITIDKLDFIQEGFMKGIMDYATFKIGHMEVNYGDAHFRRSDNAAALYNPFVGNMIMDAFNTEVAIEAYYQRNGWLAMLGVTNGRLNQTASSGTSPSTIAKIGYDKQVQPDLRVRLTGSVYHTAHSQRVYLYNGDRAGARYYMALEPADATSAGNYKTGRIAPDFAHKITAIQINPFIKYGGLEFFGVYETANGANRTEADKRNYTQLAAELVYRFGQTENLYLAGRYNTVSGETAGNYDIDVNRFNIGGGWFMTPNMLMKLEYVNQSYDGYPADHIYADGNFNGVVAEAVISF